MNKYIIICFSSPLCNARTLTMPKFFPPFLLIATPLSTPPFPRGSDLNVIL